NTPRKNSHVFPKKWWKTIRSELLWFRPFARGGVSGVLLDSAQGGLRMRFESSSRSPIPSRSPLGRRLAAALCALGLASGALGQISTTNQTTGNGGIFLNLSAATSSVHWTSFGTTYSPGTGNASVQIWTRPGSYAGFTDSSTGWTLRETVVGGTDSA